MHPIRNNKQKQIDSDNRNPTILENQLLQIKSDNSDASIATFSDTKDKGNASTDNLQYGDEANLSLATVHAFTWSKLNRSARERDSDSGTSFLEVVEARNRFSKSHTAFSITSESDETSENYAATSRGYNSLVQNTNTAVSTASHETALELKKTAETMKTFADGEIKTPPSEHLLTRLKDEGSSTQQCYHCYPNTDQERAMTVSDVLESQYYLAPLPSAVQDGEQTECTNEMDSDWEKLLDLESYGDCTSSSNHLERKVKLNEHIINLISNSSLSSWSNCSMQTHLSQLNFRKTPSDDLDEYLPPSSNSQILKHDIEPGDFIEFHHQYLIKIRESGPEDMEGYVRKSIPKDEVTVSPTLGERTMCSINSIDRVLKIQQKHPDLFKAMQEICIKRFKNFGIDDLRNGTTTRDGHASKDDNSKNESITANRSLFTERFNSSASQYLSASSCKRVHHRTNSESMKSSVFRSIEYVDTNDEDETIQSERSTKRYESLTLQQVFKIFA
ncbi:unnamed protein product [Orchesella dallaii]|uniref:Uncharacterized protein n=1 Tax=Orchesella dallaii TaxID=48710 RepID=A0ABP1Q5B3_9HEXA